MTWSHFTKSESGGVVVPFAIMFVVIAGVGGLAVDSARATNLKTKMQHALDAAVLAGVAADEEKRTEVATRIFKANLGDQGKHVQLDFMSLGPNAMEGKAKGALDSSIMALLGFSTMDVGTHTVARKAGGARVCIVVLDTAAPQALLINNGADVQSPDCEVHVHSTASPAAIFNSGTSINTQRLCIAGNGIIDNGGAHPNLELSCSPQADPYAGLYPEPDSSSCDFNDQSYTGGTINLSPGVYCGWFNFNAAPNVNFSPGVYVIKNGGWNVNGGDWSGTGVSFYYADQSKIQFNSAVQANLTAPTSGSYKGVIFFEKEGLAPSQWILNDARGFNFTGVVHLPSRDTIFNTSTTMRSKDFALVVKTLILNQTSWNLDPVVTQGASSSSAGAAYLVQ